MGEPGRVKPSRICVPGCGHGVTVDVAHLAPPLLYLAERSPVSAACPGLRDENRSRVRMSQRWRAYKMRYRLVCVLMKLISLFGQQLCTKHLLRSKALTQQNIYINIFTSQAVSVAATALGLLEWKQPDKNVNMWVWLRPLWASAAS